MVKTYLRYALDGTHGLIASPIARGLCSSASAASASSSSSSSASASASGGGALVFAAQLENVGVWNVRRGLQVQTLAPPGGGGGGGARDAALRAEVTCVAAGAGRVAHLVAVGYADGLVRLFEHARDDGRLAMQLNGHAKAVSALAFSSCGTMLASGARDTDAIHWDLVAEQGLCRLRGHRDEVTDCAFLARPALAGAPHERELHSPSLSSSLSSSIARQQTLLVTGSKDTLVKVWDLVARRCVQTIVGVRSEVWSLCVPPGAASAEQQRVIVGAADNLLRVWAVSARQPSVTTAFSSSSSSLSSSAIVEAGDGGAPANGEGDDADAVLVSMGGLTRQTHERCSLVRATDDGRLLAVQCAGKTVELLRRRLPAEVHRHVVRRLRRHREKVAKRQRGPADIDADADDAEALASELQFAGTSLAELDAQIRRLEEAEEAAAAAEAAGRPPHLRAAVTAGDEWELVGLAQGSQKVSSFAFASGEGLPPVAGGAGCASVTLVLALGNNSLEVHSLPLALPPHGQGSGKRFIAPAGVAASVTTSAGATVQLAALSRAVTLPGHRSDIRAVAVSADGALLLSCAAGQAKVWNAASGAALRTLDLGATVGLCCGFCPGSRHAVIGCKDGRLLLFDLASADLLEEHAAHSAALWSLSLRPDGKGLCTGSADKEVKFWDFDLVAKEAPGAAAAVGKKGAAAAAVAPAPLLQVLTLVHSRTLKVGEEVLCVRYSTARDASKLLVAVALVDSTVKVFFDDSLKFSLSLYGHKLPVLAMDVSADGTLLVTASADKNVKLWGLDFGDCHKSFFAHSDSVTSVGFVANTHYFFTCSKDRLLKYWDGDRFEQILTLEAHKAEVWCLAVSPDGRFVVSGSHDRSLRLWRRTEEQVFLEEERERDLDAQLDKELRDPDGDAMLQGGGGATDMVGALGADGMAVATDKDDASAFADGGAATVTADGSAMGLPEASSVVAHATRETMRGADRLAEAIALAADESDKWAEHRADLASFHANGSTGSGPVAPPRNLELLGLTPAAFVLRTLRGVRPSDVDQVLLTLPFSDALRLLRFLLHVLRLGQGVELCSRAALLLLRVHHAQLTASARRVAGGSAGAGVGAPASLSASGATGSLLPLVASLKAAMQGAVSAARDHVGFNVAGLRFVDRTLSSVAEAAEFVGSEDVAADASATTKGKGKGKKKGGAADGLRIGKRQKVQLL